MNVPRHVGGPVEVIGLPLHPLVVHAAVMATPLAALMGIGYGLVGRWRPWLRWPMTAVTVVAAVAVVTAYFSGKSLRNTLYAEGLHSRWIVIHQHRAGILLWLTIALTLVVVATSLAAHPMMSGGSVTVTRVVPAALVLLGLATLVSVFLTGDAGARAVWAGR